MRVWADDPICDIPRTLNSVCTPCLAERRRIKTGYQSATNRWYAHGKPGSEIYRQHIRERMKKWRAGKMKDPSYREYINEYHRIWRSSGGTPRSRFSEPDLDTMYVREPFDEFLRELRIPPADLERMTGVDEGVFRNSRSNKYIRLSVIDRFFTSFGMPDQVAVLWPYDDPNLRKAA